MDSTQAVPLASVSAGQPKTNTAPSVDPIPQHLGIFDTKVLDGAYYAAVLRNYLFPDRFDVVHAPDASTWEKIECLSISAGSYEWKTDWQSPSPDAARLCLLRGRISPKHLRELTSTFRLSPAFLVGHLGSALADPPTWPICPPLPSQRRNMGHVRFLTLGRTGIPWTRKTVHISMSVIRERSRIAMRELESKSRNQFGPRVRDVYWHNLRYFSVEQVVSFSFIRDDQKDNWVGECVAKTICEYWLTCYRCPFE
jgi:hypothetical protein